MDGSIKDNMLQDYFTVMDSSIRTTNFSMPVPSSADIFTTMANYSTIPLLSILFRLQQSKNLDREVERIVLSMDQSGLLILDRLHKEKLQGSVSCG